MNYKEMLEEERFERLTQNNECLIYKIAVPTNNKEENPMAILKGKASAEEMAIMINFLESSLKRLKKLFPKEAFLSGVMGKGNIEAYTNIENSQ